MIELRNLILSESKSHSFLKTMLPPITEACPKLQLNTLASNPNTPLNWDYIEKKGRIQGRM